MFCKRGKHFVKRKRSKGMESENSPVTTPPLLFTPEQEVVSPFQSPSPLLMDSMEPIPYSAFIDTATIFSQDSHLSNTLHVFKDKCAAENVDYIEEFKKLPVTSAENSARQQLRDLWNDFIDKTKHLTEEWKLEHKDGWLVKANNHMDLVEPFDEAVYDKCGFAKKSGSYWMGHNRPWRYDWIEEKYIQQLQRTDIKFPDPPYIGKKAELKAIYGENIPAGSYQNLSSFLCVDMF